MTALSRTLGLSLAALLTLLPTLAFAAESAISHDHTDHWIGWLCVAMFVVAYALVVAEEWLKLRKSIPVLLAAGAIWILIGYLYTQLGDTAYVEETVEHSLLEYGELFLFLLVAMTYINTLEERNVFDALHGWLVSRGFSLRTIYWLTGLLSFFISPVADNMTTALVMSSVAMAVGQGRPKFVVVACINIVVAANAGGAWSPFGDITTLMVWQKGKVGALEFLALFLPSIVNWLVPAALMSLAVPREVPEAFKDAPRVKPGGYVVIGLFVFTIVMTITAHSLFHLPAVVGMMAGLGLLKLFGSFLNRRDMREISFLEEGGMRPDTAPQRTSAHPFNVFEQVARAEWDTLLFFYGIILCVGGLGTLGYLAVGSEAMYTGLGATKANVIVGFASAIIDNIPVMYAVLTMDPVMSHGQWLLVTLTAGVGGSLLSIGSAAGVAVMGQAHGQYTFFAHLRWSWAIVLGYVASILVHFWVNAAAFTVIAAP
ncbi:MAG: sodium:proton antiporter NhaD [Gammaproteobacteria bacterium]|nr:sodium:proton antiporter NhaD [Gammaproteobacteria bacterium]